VEMKDQVKGVICPTKVGSKLPFGCVYGPTLAVLDAQKACSPNLGTMPGVSQEKVSYSRHRGH